MPLPYAGWVEQMTGCAPSVAQALRPYPQYCDNLQGLNENDGESLYNSLQMKLEKRFSDGIYALVSYTLSKITRSGSDNMQRDASTWSGAHGVISPFESERNDRCLRRHAARAVGGVRLRAAVRDRARSI